MLPRGPRGRILKVAKDLYVLVAYCEDLNQRIYSANTTIRRTGIATLSIASF
jgi:hypothetical protein